MPSTNGSMQVVLECLRPSGFTPRRAECRVFSRARASRRLGGFFLRQAEDFFPHFAAVGGVSRFILQSCDQQSLFTQLRTKLFALRR